MQLAIPEELSRKLLELELRLQNLGSVVVALSGGVDSSVLLKAAVMACGDKVTAITAISPSFPKAERDHVRRFVKEVGCAHLEIETDEMSNARYRANLGDRCYYCRTSLFKLASVEIAARRLGVLCYGAIPDDLGEDRPGMKAADERDVIAPLIEVGLVKEEVRQIAKAYGLSVWDKPASACLASRFPTGTEVTQDGLEQVERCEELLLALGFSTVRARYHQNMVRIELAPNELSRVEENPILQRAVKRCGLEAGFSQVEIDPKGYRTGSVHTPLLVNIGGE